MLKEEAEEYAKENYCDAVRATARNAYLDCARLKEKRIKELEKENVALKAVLYCSRKTCDNCGLIDCENFQRQRKSTPCLLYISYRDKIKDLVQENESLENVKNIYIGDLLKAKKYIRELARAVEHSYSVLNWQRPPIKAEAEQFLQESEK